jgi:hypothetical protein
MPIDSIYVSGEENMIHFQQFFWNMMLIGSVLLVANSAQSTAAEPVVTQVSEGTYSTSWLTLHGGGVMLEGKPGAAHDVPLFLGFRNHQATVAWFAAPTLSGQRIVWLDQSTVTINGNSLRGEFRGRTNLNWGSKNIHDYAVNLQAEIREGRIEGSFTSKFSGDDGTIIDLAGKLSGRFTSAEQKQRDQLAKGKNWPHYYGDGQRFSGPTGSPKLVDDLALAKPVWKSEAFVPTAHGSAPDSRYYDRAGFTDNGGGSSSPLVYEGRVYQFFYYPRGPVGLDMAATTLALQHRLFAAESDNFPPGWLPLAPLTDATPWSRTDDFGHAAQFQQRGTNILHLREC